MTVMEPLFIDLILSSTASCTELTLSSPRPSKARSLPTCYAAHARAQLVPIYSCTYYNVDDLHSGLGCVEMFDEQSSVWCCHLWTFFLHYFEKQRTIHNHVFAAWSVVYSDAVCSSCCRCVACVESSFQKVKCPIFWMMCILWKLWMNL